MGEEMTLYGVIDPTGAPGDAFALFSVWTTQELATREIDRLKRDEAERALEILPIVVDDRDGVDELRAFSP